MNSSFFDTFNYFFLILLQFALLRLIITSGIFQLLHYTWFYKTRKVSYDLIQSSQYIREIVSDLINITYNSAMVAIAIATGFIKLKSNYSITEALASFVLLFFWYETMFYYGHRLFHRPNFFWIHRHHHLSVTMTPWTVLSFSLIEMTYMQISAFSLVAIYSYFTHFPAETMIWYFIVNSVWNTAAHSNIELLPKSFPGLSNWIIGSTFHGLHHAERTGNFGLFTTFLDKLHGTDMPNYKNKLQQVWDFRLTDHSKSKSS